jgi:hypothetical protein
LKQAKRVHPGIEKMIKRRIIQARHVACMREQETGIVFDCEISREGATWENLLYLVRYSN